MFPICGRGWTWPACSHFQEAGEPERAAEYAAAAAQRAADALAFERSARLYRLARELRGGGGGDTRRTLSIKLGDVLVNAGRGSEAARAYLDALTGAPADEALELQRRAAEQFLISGHIDEGVGALREVLARTGLGMPGSSVAALASMIARRTLLRLRGLGYRERDPAEIPPETLTRIDVCWSAAKGLSLLDPARGQHFTARHVWLALRAGEPSRVSRALAFEAGHSAQGGLRTRARTAQLLQSAAAIAARIDHPHAIGLALYMRARSPRSSRAAGRTPSSSPSTPSRSSATGAAAWHWSSTTRILLGTGLFYLGEIRRLIEDLPKFLKEAEDRGDRYR